MNNLVHKINAALQQVTPKKALKWSPKSGSHEEKEKEFQRFLRIVRLLREKHQYPVWWIVNYNQRSVTVVHILSSDTDRIREKMNLPRQAGNIAEKILAERAKISTDTKIVLQVDMNQREVQVLVKE